MASLEEHERKIIIKFCHLLEKSKQLSTGLRNLPTYGFKEWHVHFSKTFDVYTKLWKFQQQQRELLDTKYGLMRWQIGEIASKIGQLYQMFYLRTSETAYLNEAYAFYYAIRSRRYYTRASMEERSELMVKKLRYYARFILVCILLKSTLVKELIKELGKQIIEYGIMYDPVDQAEWTGVLEQAKAFVRAEPGIVVINPDKIPIVVTHRLSPHSIPPPYNDHTTQMNLKLQEVLIVGSNSYQVNYSELTIDMFRILQVVEREPTGECFLVDQPKNRYNGIPDPVILNDTGLPRCETGNPHKFLLYKPSPNQVLVHLASACDELTPTGAVLVYLSAEGYFSDEPHGDATEVATTSNAKPGNEEIEIGGLITTSKSDIYRDHGKDPRSAQRKCKEGQCLYPEDLHPFTRKPLFIIIDSDNSFAFQNIQRAFGQPLIILMSQVHPLCSNEEPKHQGNLFTLFLQSPIVGLAVSCGLETISLNSYDRCQAILNSFLTETNAILARTLLDSNFYPFMGDEFLRTFLYRYIFCVVALRLHRGFKSRNNCPKSNPAFPEEIYDEPPLVQMILDMASALMVPQFFHSNNN